MGEFKRINGKTRVGMFLKRHGKTIGKGVLKVADNTLIGGIVHNILEPVHEEDAPKGKIAPKLLTRTIISSTVPAIALILMMMKVITFEQVKELLLLLGLTF